MLIPSKYNGFVDGIRRYNMDSGGSSSSPTQQSTQVSELPEWAKPYAQETLAKGQALTAQPYQTYNAPRIQGFTQDQLTAQQQARDMGPASQLGTATGLASAVGLGAMGAQYQPGQFQNQFQAPGQYTPSQFAMLQAQAPDLMQYQMGGPERVRTGSFTRPGTAEAYMSPYIEQAIAPQLREAQRASDIAGTQMAGQATQAGAFGGSRFGLMEAERQRNLATQMGDIRARGLQSAYEQAQNLYGTEQQRALQAALANQQAGLQVGGQNLQALLGVQQLGAGQNLQAQLANQQMLQSAQQAAEQSRQFGAGQGLQAAGLGAQYGQAAEQLGEQSRQFGANLGMQGLTTGLQAAGQLGQLGQTQYGQEMGINQLLNQYGQQQQALQQQGLSQAYQDFLNQQNYPYKQLGFMSDLIRGLPLGQQSAQQIYQAPGSVMGQLAGLGMGAYGLSRLAAKEGGLMQSYADGGEVQSYAPGGLTDLKNFNDKQLKQAYQNALARRDVDLADAIEAQLYENQHARSMSAEDASVAYGLGNAFDQLPEETQNRMLAGGGIVAFADEGLVKDRGMTQEEADRLQLLKAPTALADVIQAPAAMGLNVLGSAASTGQNFLGRIVNAVTGERTLPTDVAYPKFSMTPFYDKYVRSKEPKPSLVDRSDEDGGGITAEREAPTINKKTTPKLDKKTDTALTKLSEQTNTSKETLIESYDTLRKRFEEEGSADRKEMSDLIKGFMGEGKKYREQAMDRALAEFGFSMAASAAQPGQARGRGIMGALQSAATASPVLAKSAAESDKIAREMDRNDRVMALNLKQFEIAQRSGNRRDAMSLAIQNQALQRQNEQLQLQRDTLNETIRYHNIYGNYLSQKGASSSGMQKAFLSGLSRADDRASRIAKDNWGKIDVRQDLKKQGFQTFDQYYDYVAQKERRKAVPIFGVTAASEKDNDLED